MVLDLPEAKGKGQISFWSRLNFLLYRDKTRHYYKFIKLTIKWKETRPMKEKSCQLRWSSHGNGLRSKGWEGLARWVVLWRAFQEEGRVVAKAMRSEVFGHVPETGRRWGWSREKEEGMWLQCSLEGKERPTPKCPQILWKQLRRCISSQ